MLADERIVGVRHHECSRLRAIEDLRLRAGHGLARSEVADVRVADVGPHADVWLGDADERADLALVIHAELDDGEVRPVDELEQ